jgi:phospholipid/cholesterol/gamma-HCH transport system substrate-binding protein
MRQTHALELSTGLFVLLGFAALFFLITQITSRSVGWGDEGYDLTAKFDNIGGLKIRAPISMAGVTVGRVANIDFDPKDYRAVVTMKIDSKYDTIPEDSDASIYTAGLLGGQYIGISPGGSETYLKNGDRIEFTQSAIVLENLISKYLFSAAGRKGGEDRSDEKASDEKREPAPTEEKSK